MLSSSSAIPGSRYQLRQRSLNEQENPLRIGLVLHDGCVPNWVVKVIESIRGDPGLLLCGVLLTGSGTTRKKPLLFNLWRWSDYRCFGTTPSALARSEVREVDGEWQLTNVGADLNQDQMQWLAAAKLDVVLELGRDAVRGIDQLARYGSWSVVYGESQELDAEHSMFEELRSRSLVSKTAIRMHRPDGAQRVIGEAYSATNPVSLFHNVNASYWKATELLMRTLRDLSKDRQLVLPESETKRARTANPETTVPTNSLNMANFMLRWAGSAFHHKLRSSFMRESWFIALGRATDSIPPCIQDMKVLKGPPDRCLADPFIVSRDGKRYVFVEDWPCTTGRAIISCIEVDGLGIPGERRPVIERAYHLSYPNVFEWNEQVYMLPETLENGTIELYRALNFPYRWEQEAVLMHDVAAVDPTVISYAGKVWLFVGGMTENISTNDELFLFYSDSLFGPWINRWIFRPTFEPAHVRAVNPGIESQPLLRDTAFDA